MVHVFQILDAERYKQEKITSSVESKRYNKHIKLMNTHIKHVPANEITLMNVVNLTAVKL